MENKQSQEPSILEAAKTYLKSGYSVIPIKKGEKAPLIDWDEYQNRLPSENELDHWFKHTANQIGVVTDCVSGGLFILDFDGENWEGLFEEFLEKFPEFIDSLIVQTGSGKSHIYGKCPDMPRDLTRKVKHCSKGNIELRANDHQALCPPSIHPSGQRYSFVDDSKSPVSIDLQRLNEILAWMTDGQDATPKIDQKKKSEGWQEEILKGVKEGERNDSLTRLAGRLLAKKLSRSEILAVLREANSKFKPPLEDSEVETILDSMTKTNERNKPKDAWEKGRSLIEILDAPVVLPDYLVEPIMSTGDKGFLVAQYKKGKTLLITDLALSLAIGRDWLGFEVPKSRKVLYIRFELKDQRFDERLRLMTAGMGGIELIKYMPIFEYPRGFEITKQADFDWLKMMIDLHQPEVLLLDPFYKLTSLLDIKDPKNAMPLLRYFEDLRSAYSDLLILFTHHDRKLNGTDSNWDSSYGPMFFFADMDFEMKLTGGDGKFTLSFLSNDIPIEDIKIERDPKTLVHKFIGTASQDLRKLVMEILEERGPMVRSSTIEGVPTIESELKDRNQKVSSDKLSNELSSGCEDGLYRMQRIPLVKSDGRTQKVKAFELAI